MIGTDSEKSKPKWCSVLSLTKDKVLEVKLRDSIMDLPDTSAENVLKTFAQNVDKYYSRKRMHDFEYLKASILPSFLEVLIGLILSVLGCIGICAIIYNTDVEG